MNSILYCPVVFPSLCSFGFTEKGSNKGSHPAIGIYGNGFKSGSMRLGRDALIFTKNGGCQSVGMLSQTFLHNIKAQAVIVPIAPFNQQTNILYKQNTYFILNIYIYASYTLINMLNNSKKVLGLIRWGALMCVVCVFSVYVWVSFGYSGFHPQSKLMHARLIDESQLTLRVKVWTYWVWFMQML